MPCSFITVAADPADKSRYSHVYVQALLEDGSGFPLDASHGDRPGWEVPNPFRRMSWPLHTAPVTADERASRLNGLPAGYALEQSVLYGPRPASRTAGRRGVGAIDWNSIITTGMNDASGVLSTALPVALAPPGSFVQAPGVTVAAGGGYAGNPMIGGMFGGSGLLLLLIGGAVLLMMSERK